MSLHKLFSTGCLTLLAVTSVTAAPFQNGSFETSSIPGPYQDLRAGDTSMPGWAVTGLDASVGVERAMTGFTGPSYAAFDGDFYLDIAGVDNPGGGIEQSFDTIAGERYRVSFAAGNAVGFGRDGSGVLDVAVTGASTPVNLSFADATGSSLLTWFPHEFEFTAAGSSATLRFSNSQHPHEHFAALDAVSLNLVPDAGSTGLLLFLGLSGLAFFGSQRSSRQRAAGAS